jgi:hypothetical protein
MPRKLNIIRESKRRDVRHDVVSAVRNKRLEARLFEHWQQQIPARLILFLQRLVVLLRQRQSVRARSLQRRRSTHGQKVVDFADRARNLSRRDAVTNAPSGH